MTSRAEKIFSTVVFLSCVTAILLADEKPSARQLMDAVHKVSDLSVLGPYVLTADVVISSGGQEEQQIGRLTIYRDHDRSRQELVIGGETKVRFTKGNNLYSDPHQEGLGYLADFDQNWDPASPRRGLLEPTHLSGHVSREKVHDIAAWCIDVDKSNWNVPRRLCFDSSRSVLVRETRNGRTTEYSSRLHYEFSQSYYPPTRGTEGRAQPLPPRGMQEPEFDVQAEADRLILKRHAPVGVVINSALEVVQFRGRTTPYLEPAPDKPNLNILKMARNGLAIELRALVAAARKKKALVRKDGVTFDGDGRKRVLRISVSPLGEQSSSSPPDDRFFLVLFDDVTTRAIATSTDASQRRTKAGAAKKNESHRLREELAHTQDALRAVTESEEAVREQFQTATEEILSANEELQSTNEELETSKEELQSANEELTTLNDELRHKNSELHDLNNDVSNLLNSTRIPVVMLDRRHRIRRITANADRLLKVARSDIGRSISDIRLNIEVPDLEKMIARVLNTLQPMEREVLDIEHRWHSLHILPYRTLDDQIDGVVLALHDIDAMKSASEQLKRSGELFYSIINTVRQPLLVLDSDLRVTTVNQSFLHTFKVSREQTVNRFLYRIGNEQWDIPSLRARLEEILPQEQTVINFEVEHDFEHIGRRKMLLHARKLIQLAPREAMILLSIEDVTARSRAEAAMVKSEKLAASGRLAAALAHEINNPLQAVTNYMALLGQSQGLGQQDREYATLAAMELRRIVHLVQQSLGFYRESDSVASVDVEDLFESVLRIYGPHIQAKQINVTRNYKFNGTLTTSPADVRQVFSTLLVNAIEACSQGCHMMLRVNKSRDWKNNRGAQGVRVTLADNGGGIARNDIGRIFEPFFTTKGEKGTGLGLWVAQGIVQRLGGSIHVRSKVPPGQSGTCFSVFLPDQQENGSKSVE